jgi:hypothetical protein
VYIRGPRGSEIKDVSQLYPSEVPPEWLARYPTMTTLEYAIYVALLGLGKREGSDFLYQTPVLGEEYLNEFGVSIIDFLLVDTEPRVAIPANGVYWHYGRGSRVIEYDLARLRRVRAELGYDIVVIDEDDAMQLGATTLVILAYNRVDISRLSGLI